MKIVTTDAGRILDLIPLEELRPRGGVYLPDLVSGIVSRYGFTSLPRDLNEAQRGGAKCEFGKFKLPDGPVAVKELALYSDGVICEAYNTDIAEMVLDDFFEWATATFKLQERRGPIRRTYTSGIVCEFDR